MPLSNEMLGKVLDEEGKLATHVDMLIYGKSKSGRTYRASTAPNPYLITADPTGHKSIPYAIPGRVVSSITQVREDLEEFKKGGHGFDSLILDGLSFMHDLYVKEVGQYFVAQFGAKDEDMISIGARGKILKTYKELLSLAISLTDLPNKEDRVHVICTTDEERVKESEDAPFSIRPHFGTKSMNQEYPKLFSIISYIKPTATLNDDGTIDESRKMLFAEYEGIQAGDRLKMFPSFCDEAPNLSEYLT